MARLPRSLLAGYCYHAINRGNSRATVFRDPRDYRAFLQLMTEAQVHCTLPIIAVCLMPNHFHIIAKPVQTGEMSRWFHWLLTTHVSHYHKTHGTSGRVWNRVPAWLIEPPGGLPRDWRNRVNMPQTAAEESALRCSVNRQRPYGDEGWVSATAVRLGLEHSLRNRGRQKKLADPAP